MLTVVLQRVENLKRFFFLPINFSQLFFLFHYMQVWTDRSQLALLCLSSCCLAASALSTKHSLHFFPLLGMGWEGRQKRIPGTGNWLFFFEYHLGCNNSEVMLDVQLTSVSNRHQFSHGDPSRSSGVIWEVEDFLH